jgi:hypothetical protein
VQLCKDTFAEREDFTLRGFSIDDRAVTAARFGLSARQHPNSSTRSDEAIAAVDHGNSQTHRG